jgi:hypothetical protein
MILLVRVNLCGQMVLDIKGNGLITRSKAKEYFLGLMAKDMKETISQDEGTDRGNFIGVMVLDI